ncbi:DUF928 domain-containing protein [Pleurocapsa sp. PCC 7319]|uniref:DUF928 domain-containing protein n=1 Tax=Pleurocapsa sp. PCC 7319 TaxID=118161 RepID=UPI000371702E|nr:DUF928 domain-containing protein [Pleurocapsa sp. PCC 7319]
MGNNFLIDTKTQLIIIDLSKGLIQKILTTALFMAIAGYPLIAEAKRPKAPQTGTPSGHTTPGTTRPEANCPDTPKPLTGLFANRGQDFTLSEFPTFLFYVPYGAKDISLMEFLLLDETQTKTIYHTSVQLNQQPGIIKIQLPQEARYALVENQTYHWRFNLDCQSNQAIVPDLFLQGWIRRIPITSEIKNQLQSAQSSEYLVYRDQGIWYDAIANLAELHFATPANEQLTKDWNDILRSIKLDWIIAEPLVDSKKYLE